jgi:hypothetical protein
MPLQASQTVPEKPGNRGGEDQEQISQKSACEREEEGVQELQEFRSYRMGNRSTATATLYGLVERSNQIRTRGARLNPFKTAEQLANSATPELLT